MGERGEGGYVYDTEQIRGGGGGAYLYDIEESGGEGKGGMCTILNR